MNDEADASGLESEILSPDLAGRWSVDMFAMFHLGRMDVLPVGDLGVRNGMKELYGLKVSPAAHPFPLPPAPHPVCGAFPDTITSTIFAWARATVVEATPCSLACAGFSFL